MKTRHYHLLLVLTVVLCSCETTEYSKIQVGWPPGYAYVPKCKTLVKYQGTSIDVQGVKIPVPQLGGAAEVGGVKVDPVLLNRAYHTTQTLDTAYHNSCTLLPAFTTDKAKFENAVQEMQDAQTKLQQLAMSFSNIEQGGSTATTQPASATAAKPEASPSAKKPAATAVSTTAASSATPPAAKEKKVKRRLSKWVTSYSKPTKAATVKTRPKPNAALELPPAAPTPTPPRS